MSKIGENLKLVFHLKVYKTNIDIGKLKISYELHQADSWLIRFPQLKFIQ